VVAGLAIYFAVEKKVPFTHGYRLNAIFSTAIDMVPGSPVRVAGVDAGSVTGIKRIGEYGEVSMEISSAALPIHADAQLKIRPRTFLEGNWFVELQPGSPGARVLPSGSTIPVTQTADPVQLENVLDALNSQARSNLQELLIEYGRALAEKPSSAENAQLEAEVKGLSGAEALDRAATHGPAATRDSAIVNQALAGTHERDLSTLVEAIKRVSAGLDAHPRELGELISNFNTFFEEFARNSESLKQAVHQLPGAFTNAKRAFIELGNALPSIRSFSEAIIPGVEETPATVAAYLPWIAQARALFSPAELGAIAKGSREAAPPTAELVFDQVPFEQQGELFNRCLTNVLIPAGNVRLQDGANTSGETAYREFWYGLVGGNSIGQSFSGNGLQGLSALVGGGGPSLRSAPAGVIGQHTTAGQSLVARTALAPLGTRPLLPADEPPYEPLVPCYKQQLPEFNGPLAGPGPADGSGG
jgi:phospholipid/cholesterol/gamma-HCH transport system substrate-binding protein